MLRSFAAPCLFGLVAHAAAQEAASPGETALSQGVLLLRQGHPAEAIKPLSAAVAAMPRSSAALIWRGLCENQTEDYAAAARDLRAAARLDPASLPAHYNLALSLIRLRHIDEAVAELKTVLQLQPEAVPARYNLAVLLEDKKDYAQAAEELRQAHHLAADDAGIALHLMEDQIRLHVDEGLPELVHQLAESSVPTSVQQQGGTALLEAGHFTQAASLLSSAHARDPDSRDTTLLLARAYVGAGQNAEAITLLAEAPGAQSDEEMVYTAGLAYMGAGDRASAAARFKAAAALEPRDGRPLYHLALLALGSENGQAEADTLLRQALHLDPNNRAFSLALARILLATDRAPEAKARLQGMEARPADEVERSTLLGVALASTNELAQAIPDLQRAISLDPQLALAHNVLGFCFFRRGDYGQAAAAFHEASDLEPGRLFYARDAALAYLRAAADASAIPYAERAAALPNATASDYALLGKLYAATGRQQDALGLLHRAVKADPNLDTAVYLLARTYRKLGKQDEAKEWSEKLTALKAQHEATFLDTKKKEAAVQSSQVLAGGTVSDDTDRPE